MRLAAASIADSVVCNAPLVDVTLHDLKFEDPPGTYFGDKHVKETVINKKRYAFHQYRKSHTSPQSLTYSDSKRGVTLQGTGYEKYNGDRN